MGDRVGAFKTAGAAFICTLVLTGCVQINAAPTSHETTEPPPPSQQPTDPPADGGKYASVVELRDALVKAGLPCPKWHERGRTGGSMSSADCSENTLIATYSSWDDLNKQLNSYRAMGEYMHMTVLVGVNWTIDSPLADKFRDKLGGYIYESTGKR